MMVEWRMWHGVRENVHLVLIEWAHMPSTKCVHGMAQADTCRITVGGEWAAARRTAAYVYVTFNWHIVKKKGHPQMTNWADPL
eukprot:scaffold22465_cov27-Tisochrysis_lutea.AAC.1